MGIATRHALPGFRLTLGLTLAWLGALVLLPLAALVAKSASGGWAGFVATMMAPRAVAALRFTVLASLAAAALDAVFGGLLAWVLVRYPFPGRRLVDALVDLPLALPTAVAGIALTAIWAPNGWLGAPLARAGVQVAFAPAGVIIALAFVGLPFVVRTVQPIIE